MISPMAIVTKDLVKRYGKSRALDGFSVSVPEGSIMGLVGPNGAGKTTWMMCVVGLLNADAGEISLLGGGAFDSAQHSGRVAMLPQDSELPLEMSPRSLFRTFARLQGISGRKADAAAEEVLQAVHLDDCASKPIRALSHGMRKRVMAGQCFIGNPDLLLLDEPMNGPLRTHWAPANAGAFPMHAERGGIRPAKLFICNLKSSIPSYVLLCFLFVC